MALAEMTGIEQTGRRSVRQVRADGRDAVAKLAQAERLRAQAVAQLVEFDAINGHAADGYLTPQRHLIHRAGLSETEANRMQRLVRFCQHHPLIAEQLADGRITIDHADELGTLASHVDTNQFTDALPDLLHAAVSVELAVFVHRIRVWRWRTQPEVTGEDLETTYDNRSLTMQPGLFGGCRGQFVLDPAGAAIVADALHTRPDPTDTLDGPRTLAQRNADRLVELAAIANRIDSEPNPTLDDLSDDLLGEEPEGARQTTRSTVDVIVDLPTLIGADFSLDDHRDSNGDVDWDSIQASFALTGSTPRPGAATVLL